MHDLLNGCWNATKTKEHLWRKKVLSQLNVSLAQTPRVIMGFLKKKWLRLLSKRKSKVNVSIMRLMLIVKLGSQ